MKAEGKKVTREFTPVTIDITLETEEELFYFFCVHNYNAICKATPFSHEPIRGALQNAYGKALNYHSVWEAFISDVKARI